MDDNTEILRSPFHERVFYVEDPIGLKLISLPKSTNLVSAVILKNAIQPEEVEAANKIDHNLLYELFETFGEGERVPSILDKVSGKNKDYLSVLRGLCRRMKSHFRAATGIIPADSFYKGDFKIEEEDNPLSNIGDDETPHIDEKYYILGAILNTKGTGWFPGPLTYKQYKRITSTKTVGDLRALEKEFNAQTIEPGDAYITRPIQTESGIKPGTLVTDFFHYKPLRKPGHSRDAFFLRAPVPSLKF